MHPYCWHEYFTLTKCACIRLVRIVAVADELLSTIQLILKMKRFLTSFLACVIVSSGLFAQQVNDSLRYAESIWSMQKKALILEQMNLTEAEKSAFWPVYESYANAIQYLDMEYIRLLNFEEEGLSEKKTASLTESMLMNELLLAKTRKQYYRKFNKALGAAQASKFMQLDYNFRTMLRLGTQRESPALASSLFRIYSRN